VQAALAGSDPELSSHEGEPCPVCAEPIVFRALYSCGHAEICGMCAARVRLLAGNRLCMYCKTDCEHIVITSQDECASDPTAHEGLKRYADYGIYGDLCGPDLSLDHASGIFFHRSANHLRVKLSELRQFKCGAKLPKGAGVCEASFGGLPELNGHLASSHANFICDLCAEHRAVFVQELPRLTGAQLADHCKRGDPSVGFYGHPLCKFCNKRFFSDSELFAHLQVEHFLCHLCGRADPSRRQYFNTYADLEEHFGDAHFLCTDAGCRARHFVVFGSLLELTAHSASEHGTDVDLSAHLAFRYAGSDSRGGRRGGRLGASGGREAAADSGRGDRRDAGAVVDGTSGGHLSHIELTNADFPTLAREYGGLSDEGDVAALRPPGRAPPAERGEAYPRLGGGGPSAAAHTPSPAASSGPRGQTHFHRAVAAGGSRAFGAGDFPTLGLGAGGGSGGGAAGGSFRSAAAAGPSGRVHPFGRLHAYSSLDSLLRMSGQSHLLGGAGGAARGGAGPKASPLPSGPRVPGQLYVDEPLAARPELVRSAAAQQQRPAAAPAAAARPAPVAAARNVAAVPPPAVPAAAARPPIAPALSSPASAPAPAPAPVSAVAQLSAALAAVPGAFDSLRALSTQYRAGELSPQAYHDQAVGLFDAAAAAAGARGAAPDAPSHPLSVFATAFPALIDKLPEADRQAPLRAVHEAWLAAQAKPRERQRAKAAEQAAAAAAVAAAEAAAAPAARPAPAPAAGADFPSLAHAPAPKGRAAATTAAAATARRYADATGVNKGPSAATSAALRGLARSGSSGWGGDGAPAAAAAPAPFSSSSSSFSASAPPPALEDSFPSMPSRPKPAGVPLRSGQHLGGGGKTMAAAASGYRTVAAAAASAPDPAFPPFSSASAGAGAAGAEEERPAPAFAVSFARGIAASLDAALAGSQGGGGKGKKGGSGGVRRQASDGPIVEEEDGVFRVIVPKQGQGRKAEEAADDELPSAAVAKHLPPGDGPSPALAAELERQRQRELRKAEKRKRKAEGDDEPALGGGPDASEAAYQQFLRQREQQAAAAEASGGLGRAASGGGSGSAGSDFPALGGGSRSVPVAVRSIVSPSMDSLLAASSGTTAAAVARRPPPRTVVVPGAALPKYRTAADLDRLLAASTGHAAAAKPAAPASRDPSSLKGIDDDLAALMVGVKVKQAKPAPTDAKARAEEAAAAFAAASAPASSGGAGSDGPSPALAAELERQRQRELRKAEKRKRKAEGGDDDE